MPGSRYSLLLEELRKGSFSLRRHYVYAAAAGLSVGILLTCLTVFLFTSSSKFTPHHTSPTSPPTTTTSPSHPPQTLSNLSRACAQKEKVFMFFTHVKKTWFEAMADCHSKNMYFASTENEKEYQTVLMHIRNMHLEGVGQDFWLSGTDLGHGGRFVWMSTGLNVTFSKWHQTTEKHEPNNDRYSCGGSEMEYCMELLQEYQYEMNDNCCSKPKYYICEYWICDDHLRAG